MKMLVGPVALLLALSFPLTKVAAQSADDYGKAEYESNCASCHGVGGKGDGPLTKIYIPMAPADLTTMAKRNGGVFPTQRAHEIIDGRQAVPAHGPRVMPVWGRDYYGQAPDLEGFYDLRATITSARIAALVDYLFRLQEKN